MESFIICGDDVVPKKAAAWPLIRLLYDDIIIHMMTLYVDVTLASEDDQQVEAHKVILAGQVFFSKLSHSQHDINNINILININSVE